MNVSSCSGGMRTLAVPMIQMLSSAGGFFGSQTAAPYGRLFDKSGIAGQHQYGLPTIRYIECWSQRRSVPQCFIRYRRIALPLIPRGASMASAEQHRHLSEKDYWNARYGGDIPRAIDIRDRSLRNYLRRYQHREFSRWLGTLELGRGSRLIEVGCGGSVWLPYFAREHGFDVTGLDYATQGCAAAVRALERDGAEGRVFCADFFDPPAEMLGAFDIVLSNGVVEHFATTSEAIAACARFLRPGGAMMTLIPNLAGFSGAGLRFFNRGVYDMHVPMTAPKLAEAHEEAGLKVLTCDYMTPMWFGDWSVPREDKRKGRRLLRNLLWYPSAAFSAGVWMLDDLVGNRIPGSRLFSPWSVCWARKPAA
jgi:2-polyprenyl-3-methyl-5-hydroxy-6-metoxy-1,4-benzoquinol methylase